MKTKLKSNCFISLINIGGFREIVMIGNTPYILKSRDSILLDKDGGGYPNGTEISYNSLTVKIKEIHES